MKKLLIILGIISALILVVIVYFYLSLFGNPLEAIKVTSDAKLYVRENYPNFKLNVVGNANYDYKVGSYRISISGDDFFGEIFGSYSGIRIDDFKSHLENQAEKELTGLIDKHRTKRLEIFLMYVGNFDTKKVKPKSDFKNIPLDIEILIKTLDILTDTEIRNLLTVIDTDIKNNGYLVKNYTIDPCDSNLQKCKISSLDIESGKFESLNLLFKDK